MASHVVTVGFEQPRMSYTKYIERRIICAWKAISRRSRRRNRVSMLPEDFVLLTARRRSVRYV
ncbi:hypothetical protein L226DRAFT_569626 [Lentinus tigrinus ALCF2SS1-7]|uniref:Uncharacterized protein n=1 Tax=Lentinus tigrinus ALCF2SS1-6 TaxID=1328759 RepID=A0A5C2SK86_9APHY|nr:hypothetical protein L227DRAFT_607848 [Lentinus tigrinus ALCF2SS1-6]RPD76353.1 hypothetical protein L226DRAFT_569626 [Lentinus tigrinus ALCF2SS1-7]